MIKNITELTIFESPDGGKTVYARKSGSPQRQLHSISEDLMSQLAMSARESHWMAILHVSERSPALQEAIDRVITIYELTKTDSDDPVMWHPV